MRPLEQLSCDILVIGTGIAGLSFALRAAEFATVVMATKKEQSASNTNYAQGGIATVLAPTDSFESHLADTLSAGAGLCREEVVREIVSEGPQAVRDLLSWGVSFSQATPGPALHLGLEGGHSSPRVVHAGDFTGREIERALLGRAEAEPRIRVLEHHIAARLLVAPHPVSGKPACFGADIMPREGGAWVRVTCRAVLLATGGAGQVYQHTTNPTIATGDGIALAYAAGAPVANLEFMQFHPTSLYRPGQETFLVSEAVRGDGAILRNSSGDAFMTRYDVRAELAPRDIVARAIDQEMKESGAPFVLLDITHKSAAALSARFPNIYAYLKKAGIDMATDPIPVVPAAHYLCGGVECEIDGRTEISGLLVSGEVAHTGMHGANRLASNSLLEAVVISRKAAARLRDDLPERGPTPDFPPMSREGRRAPGVLVSHLRRDIRQIMWDYVGIVRSNQRLDWARRALEHLAGELGHLKRDFAACYELLELENLLCCARLMTECACRRKESRGLHFNRDFPPVAPGTPGRDTVLRIDTTYGSA
jgi:L-aspartate oxidase